MPAQTFVEGRPPAALTDLVSTVWTQSVPADSEPYRHRSIPNGSAEVVCRIGERPRIVGPRSVPGTDVLAPGTTAVGARLRPGAASAVFGVAADELVDLDLDLAELPARAPRDRAERLAGAGSPRQALHLLQRDLAVRSAAAPTVDPVVTEAVHRLEEGGHGGLRTIRSDLYLSERHFRRRIREAAGLAPKVLERTLRFQRLLASAQYLRARGGDPAEAGLAALAAAAGYADESHLNRECRRLTGLSVGRFLGEVNRDCGCGHDHGASFSRLLGLAEPVS